MVTGAELCTSLNSDEDSDVCEEHEGEEDGADDDGDDTWEEDWDIGERRNSDAEQEDPPASVW
ncbi:hypothetical protein PI124_g527 [Phytophthora idaei]|nr:hypothetical protein PI125_g4244 [Phytophthora idaei]KAG3167301.1 hypothetical protein PI126_g3841 [Phytophthora idaei]KAG3254895.1 hypothetical protein PI124_g527 [Phytophthora idaei]